MATRPTTTARRTWRALVLVLGLLGALAVTSPGRTIPATVTSPNDGLTWRVRPARSVP